MNAVGYCRISDQDQSNNSLTDQEFNIRQYCKTNGLTLDKIFIENGKSAFTFDRPEWLKLESYIKKNKSIKYLIVKHIDRFSRAKLMDALVKLNEIENKLKVKVLTVADPVNLDSKDFASEMMRTVMLLFSHNERTRIVERTRDGIYRSLAQGRFCNRAPYGYKNTIEDGKPLIIPDENASVVKKIFSLAADGLAPEEIKRKIPQFKQKSSSAIQRILANELYAGLINLPAYRGNPSGIIDAIHEPLISKQLFYMVQSMQTNRGVSSQKADEVYLRGVISCSCGRLMTAGNSKGRSKFYWYYYCKTCKVNYKKETLHEHFDMILDELSLSDEDYQAYTQKTLKLIKDYQNSKGGLIMRANLELDKLKKKIDKAQERYLLNPSIDEVVYAKTMTEMRLEEERLKAELSDASKDEQALYDRANKLLPFLRNIKNAFHAFNVNAKQVFLSNLFARPIVWDGKIGRTAGINKMFADKSLILKEKGLIEIDKSLSVDSDLKDSTQNGSVGEPIFDLFEQSVRLTAG